MKKSKLYLLLQACLMTTLVSGSSLAFADTEDELVAIVDNRIILKSDLQQGMRERTEQLELQKQAVPPRQILQYQVLDDLILRQAQLDQAKRYGLRIDEKTLNDAILKLASDSGVTTLQAFQSKLDAQKAGSYAELRSRMAEDLVINRLRQQQVMARIKVTDQDVQNFLNSPEGQALAGNELHIIHVLISGKDKSPEQLAKTAAEVKAALNSSNDIQAIGKTLSQNGIEVTGADMGFRKLNEIPADLAVRVSALSDGQTTDPVPSSNGLHVIKLIERKDNTQKAIVTQYNTQHILIQPTEVMSPDNAKQMIDSLYARLKAGDDFGVLAATYSADPGSAGDQGSLGWVTPGIMVPEFENVMKSTPIGEISPPFQTQFGWHILKVLGTREKDMTQEYRERAARKLLAERQFDTELDSWLREVRAGAYVEIKDVKLEKSST